MKNLTLLLILFSILIYNNAYANDQTAEYYHFAISGGVSLGIYEAGMCWAIVKNFNEYPQQTGKIIGSFSGSSAGSINALLSAIEYLKGKQPYKYDAIINNSFRNSWDIGIEDLLELKKDSEEKSNTDQTDQGLFSRNAIISKIENIEAQLKTPSFKNGRQVAMAFSVSKQHAYERIIKKTGASIKQHHYVFIIVAEVIKGKVVFKNFDLKKAYHSGAIPGSHKDFYLRLHEDERGEISFSDISQVVFASSAFPIAFSPVKIEYCRYQENFDGLSLVDKIGQTHQTNSDKICGDIFSQKGWFSDGGMFDNAMVGNAEILSKSRNQKSYIVHMDPYNSDEDPDKETDKESEKTYFGLEDYFEYLFSSFNVARSAIYHSDLKKLNSNDSPEFYRTKRNFLLMGTFHQNFSAFYAKDFRLHDFLVGVYDGMKFQHQSSQTNNSRYIRPDLLEHWEKIKRERHGSDYDPDTDVAYEFLSYLHYRDSTKNKSASYKIGNKFDNKLIAISEALKSTKVEPVLSKDKKEYNLENVIIELKKLKSTKYRNAKFSENSADLIDRFPYWITDIEKSIYHRLVEMQIKVDQNEEESDDFFTKGLIAVKPYIGSQVHYMNTKIWPLSYKINDRVSGTVYYGYDTVGATNRITGKLRFATFEEMPCSVDLSASWHLQAIRVNNNDYYPSVFAGITYHRNQIAIPTLTLGYSYTFDGQYYDDDLHSIQGEVASLDGLVTLGGAVSFTTPSSNYRKQSQFIISVDVVKIFGTIKNLWN